MYKMNSNCNDCNYYYKVVWNCKKNILEKDWLYLCYNCIRLNRKLYKRYFKSQLENIKGFSWCRVKLSKVELSLYKINI